MTTIDKIKVFDRDGEERLFAINRCGDHYVVTLDSALFASAEKYREANAAIVKAIHDNAWTFTRQGTA